jgi:hypothetical protein
MKHPRSLSADGPAPLRVPKKEREEEISSHFGRVHGRPAYILNGFRRYSVPPSAAQHYFLQVKLHQMLKVIMKVLLGKTR